MSKRTKLLWVVLLLILLVLVAWSPGAPAQEEDRHERNRQALLAIHEADIRHHVEGDVDALVSTLPETFLMVGGGQIRRQPKSEIRAFFERYLEDAEYEQYADLEPPIVRISGDGTMAWVISRLHVKRTQRREGAEPEKSEFVYAGIMTYEKVDGRWMKVANVSTFER